MLSNQSKYAANKTAVINLMQKNSTIMINMRSELMLRAWIICFKPSFSQSSAEQRLGCTEGYSLMKQPYAHFL